MSQRDGLRPMNATIGSFIAVGAGAAIGAWLRWGLSLWLNTRLVNFPLGTFVSNMIGGYLIGLALAYHSDLPPQMRLFVITGFLGGLTTFSTFSSEVIDLLQRGEIAWGATLALAHLAGSLLLTVLGFATYRALA